MMTTAISHRRVAVGQAQIETTITGDGDAVLLLPGLGGAGCEQYADLAPRLAGAGYCAVAVDPRGVAGSSGPLRGLTLHDFAADAAGVIEALNAAPAHVVGSAYGNRVARCLAADRPELVRTVTLLAAGGMTGPKPGALLALLRLACGRVSAQKRQKLLKRALFSPASQPPAGYRPRIWRKAALAQHRASRATPLVEWWSGGQAPMLVIQGLDDGMAPPANGRQLKAALGDRVRLVELTNAGHALLVEQAERVTAEILAFIASHP